MPMHVLQVTQLLNAQKNRKLHPSQIGRIVDTLYELEYFHNLGNIYGRQYLVLLVHHKLLQTHIIRKNKPIIDTQHLYVLLEGKLSKHGFSNGSDLTVQRDGQIVTLQDCMFLKININRRNKIKSLREFQLKTIQVLTSIQTKVQHEDEKQYLIQKIKEIQLFSKLPRSDFLQFAYGCQLKNILKGKLTHEYSKKVDNIIFIIDGQIKIIMPFEVEEEGMKVDSFLEKYLVKKKVKSNHSITTNYSKNDWIGIEEHFEQHNYKSFGIIMSVQAKILYIPTNLFDKIFNEESNYAAYSKIKYMRKIKADLLEKSSKVQKQKQSQMLRWSQQKRTLSPELRKKLSKYQFDIENDQQSIKNPQNYRQNTIGKPQIQQKPIIPIKVVHMVQQKSIEDLGHTQINTSFISQEKSPEQTIRINLFPDDYNKQFIRPHEKLEIDDARYKKNMDMMMYMSPRHHRKVCVKSKETLVNKMIERDEKSFEKSFFTMTKNITQNFVLGSTFYRNYLNKGDDNCNLNFKTINSIQPSRKDLLLRRRSHVLSDMQSKSTLSVILPTLKTKSTVKNFHPMSPHKNSNLDLSTHLMNRNYHLDSSNSLLLKQKQSHQTLHLRNYTTKSASLKEYSKTLFVDIEREIIKKQIQKHVEKQRRKTSFLKKQGSILSIQ